MISQDFLDLISSDYYKFICESKFFSINCIICGGKFRSNLTTSSYRIDCGKNSNCSSTNYQKEANQLTVKYYDEVRFAFRVSLNEGIVKVHNWLPGPDSKPWMGTPVRFSFPYDISQLDLSSLEGMMKFKKHVDKLTLL